MKERSRLADVFYVLTIMGTVWGMIWLFPFIWTVVILGIKQCFSCRLDFSAQIDKLPFLCALGAGILLLLNRKTCLSLWGGFLLMINLESIVVLAIYSFLR